MLTKFGQWLTSLSPISTVNHSEDEYLAEAFKEFKLDPTYSTEYVNINTNMMNSSTAHYQKLWLTGNSSSPILFINNSSTSEYAFVIIGSGTTSPTVDDRDLSDRTGFYANSQIAGTVQTTPNSDNSEVTLKVGVTNNSNSDIVITEIGFVQQVNGKKGTRVGQFYMLVDHTLLDTPLTIPAGESGTIDYTFTVVNQSASLNSVSPMRAAAKLAEVQEDDEAESDDDIDPNKFIGLSAEAVWDSLSYRPAKHELHLACDWLGIEYDKDTNAQLKAKLAEAAGVKI